MYQLEQQTTVRIFVYLYIAQFRWIRVDIRRSILL